MAELDIIKEIIDYEQLLDQINTNIMVRGEYLIPDTHPDVVEILQVDSKAIITNKEVQQERLYIEGKLNFNVSYLAKEDEGFGVRCVNWNDKFAHYVDLAGSDNRFVCDTECEIEHIDANIINERKISLETKTKIGCDVYDAGEFEYVKDIEGSNDIEMKRKTEVFDKVVYKKSFDMVGKCNLKVAMDKNQIGSIVKCKVDLHKKEVKISDGKVELSCYCKIEAIYRDLDSRELNILEEDLCVSQEEDIDNINMDMISTASFRANSVNYLVSKDDLGEDRILDIEILIDGDLKVTSKEHIEIIEDAYSPSRNMELKKDIKNISLLIDRGSSEYIVKDNIEIDSERGAPIQIISTIGKIINLEKRINDGKVLLDGIIGVDVLYKTSDEERGIGKVIGEIPFSTIIDIPKVKEDMKALVKSCIETIQANIEANTIGIKAIITSVVDVFKSFKKACITSIDEKEEEMPSKKASLTIYVVQRGDTIWDLAKKYNSTISELVNINDFENPEDIIVGEKIIIPGRALL